MTLPGAAARVNPLTEEDRHARPARATRTPNNLLKKLRALACLASGTAVPFSIAPLVTDTLTRAAGLGDLIDCAITDPEGSAIAAFAARELAGLGYRRDIARGAPALRRANARAQLLAATWRLLGARGQI